MKTALSDLNDAYQNFFKKRSRYPKFKSKKKSKNVYPVCSGIKFYVKDNKLYLCDFNGNSLTDVEMPLYFNNYNGNGIKAFSIDIMGNQLRIATPKTNEQTHYVTEYYFDSVTYSFIRTRENVKETVE